MAEGGATASGTTRVLVVDDERPVRRFLRTVLEGEGFAVHEAENGRDGLAAAAAVRPEIVLLDLGLPDADGVEVLRRLREWSKVPVVVLSVREREEEKVRALDAGADDYLTKPFGVPELLARMRVALRRALAPREEPVFRAGELEVDLARRRVFARGAEVALTPMEYDLLRLLVAHAGRVVTRGEILRRLWGAAHAEQPHVLRVTMSNLRRKLEEDPSRPRLIRTELGVGYRLREGD